MSLRRAPIFLLVGWTLLLTAWTFSNPPFSSPDEWAHYLRAVGISEGHLLGKPAPTYTPAGLSQAQLAWARQTARTVPVPQGLGPDYSGCNALDADASAACLDQAPSPSAKPEIGQSGTYQPLPYLAPAAALRLGGNWQAADRWARAASALLCLGCFAWVIVLAGGSGLLGLTGLAAAVPPMSLFVSSALQPSGLEVASATLLAVALIRLVRAGTTSAWVAAGAAGFLLAMSRSTGPLWLALLVVVAFVLAGPGGALERLRERRRAALVASTAILIGVALNGAWAKLYGPSPPLGFSPFPSSVADGIRALPEIFREEVGVFDYLEWRLPDPFYLAWWGAVAALVGAALFVGRRRERSALVSAVAIAVAAPIILYAGFLRNTGFGVQGRYVLPFTLMLPLLAGDILDRRSERLSALPRRAFVLVLPLLGGLQLYALLDNAHRHAVGIHGTWLFPTGADWSPPLGWWTWLGVATAGAVSLAAVPFSTSRVARATSSAADPRARDLTQ